MVSTLLSMMLSFMPADAAGPVRLQMLEQLAEQRLRAGRFQAAAADYDLLATETAAPGRALRFATIARLLRETGGIYTVSEPYPSDALLMGLEPLVPTGPALLSDPDVLRAALRDSARALIDEAVGHLDLGRDRMPSDAAMAAHHATEARRALDSADALSASAGAGYRPELARLGLQAYRARAREHAGSFDREIAALASDTRNSARRLARIRRLLAATERNLTSALEFARQDADELAGQARRTRQDLQAVRRLRSLLPEPEVVQ